jgi:hypothetical protein
MKLTEFHDPSMPQRKSIELWKKIEKYPQSSQEN